MEYFGLKRVGWWSVSSVGGQPDLVIVFFITKEPSFSCLSAKLDKQPVGAGWEFYFRGAVMPPQMHTQQVTIKMVVIHSAEGG